MSESEKVARAIFSPRMIYNGELQPEAFQLRATIGEEYLSVLRMAIPSWQHDMMLIPQLLIQRRLVEVARKGLHEI